MPLRLEVVPGYRKQPGYVVRRDTGEKIATALPDLEAAILLLSAIQDNMLAIARVSWRTVSRLQTWLR